MLPADPSTLPNGKSVLDRTVPYNPRALLRGGGTLPLHRHDAFVVQFEGFESQVPRATNARHTLGGQWRATEGFAGYHAQEKLDGLFVLWTGARLITKAGQHVQRVPSSFTEWLPPGFPLVGELYLGNNTLELARTLVGTSSTKISPLWAHARLVAFDVPGCNPPDQWPYDARYALLRHVVGAWNHRLLPRVNGNADLLPLQLIRRFAADRIPELFRAIVHGVPWDVRVEQGLQPFGVPETVAVHNGSTTPTRLAVNEKWLAADVNPFAADVAQDPASGEGCMLWQSSAPWASRGRNLRGMTTAILKYKPTVLTTAIVHDRPYHSHRTPYVRGSSDGNTFDEDRLPGYHVRLVWEAPFNLTPVTFKAWIPPRSPEDDVVAAFPPNTRTFVAFVAYGRQPEYARALGRRLSTQDARPLVCPSIGPPVASRCRSTCGACDATGRPAHRWTRCPCCPRWTTCRTRTGGGRGTCADRVAFVEKRPAGAPRSSRVTSGGHRRSSAAWRCVGCTGPTPP